MNVKALTVIDLAARWQCSRTIIYEMVRSNKIPHFLIGNRIRFNPVAIHEYEIEQGTRTLTAVEEDIPESGAKIRLLAGAKGR